MLVPNPDRTASKYRYGFNGKEMDNEVKGEGAQYDYGFRIYDPRIGKFLSQDPLFQTYPWLTPYQFASNSPIWAVDLDGLESKIVILGQNGLPTIMEKTNDNLVEWQAKKASYYKAFANHAGWVEGKDEYQKNGSPGPIGGTLTINAMGNTAKISYKEGTAMQATVESFSQGIHAMKVFIYKPDPLVEGSGASSETIQNYVAGVTFFMGGGLKTTLNLGPKSLAFLKSPIGKGVFETIAQILVKGDVKKVDITDVAAQVLVNNRVARDAIKSILDTNLNDGMKLKELDKALTEFGLRRLMSKVNDKERGKETSNGESYVIDVIKKIELDTAKEKSFKEIDSKKKR
jgi:RHS repeat-associated protein